jgi:hypothetical protein
MRRLLSVFREKVRNIIVSAAKAVAVKVSALLSARAGAAAAVPVPDAVFLLQLIAVLSPLDRVAPLEETNFFHRRKVGLYYFAYVLVS